MDDIEKEEPTSIIPRHTTKVTILKTAKNKNGIELECNICHRKKAVVINNTDGRVFTRPLQFLSVVRECDDHKHDFCLCADCFIHLDFA